LSEAEAHLRNVLRHDPDNVIALHDLGILAFRDGRRSEALDLLHQALLLQPNHIDILKSYGQILRHAGKPTEALETFLHTLDLDPRDAGVWNAAGVCFQETGNSAKALEAYLRSLALRPDSAETLNNISVVLFHEGDTDAAIEHLHQALALEPAYPDAFNNLAVTHRARLEYRESTEAFQKAFHLDPNNPEIAGGLGEILSLIYDEAAESTLRQAVALAPNDPEKHWNLGLELLKRGKYLEGWREYEWRWQRGKGHNPLRPFTQPFWRGEPGQDIRGATILLHAEQGFGDTLQMLRYVPLVLAHGARIVLEVPQPLQPLVAAYSATMPGEVTVIAAGDPLPTFDWHTALLSLPLACGSTLETIPPPIRLTPARQRSATSDRRRLRIGLAWAGNPAHPRDRERSLTLDLLKPLFDVPGCSWVSLQTGTATQQIQPSSLPLERVGLHNFADTAAVLDTLDLVISVDSAVAHLAATQGIPTWILLPFVADWRWLLPPKPDESPIANPWYPQARLFRQAIFPTISDAQTRWSPIVTAVRNALRELVAAR